MKKIININFQGRIIPIEETSFDILKQYIDSLRVYFAREEGSDEIINDIESRIAELFTDRLKHTACITDEDVNKVIAGIGRPEDLEEEAAGEGYAAGNGTTERQNAGEADRKTRKSLFRSANDATLGGVCAGLAAYFNIDPAFMRIFFIILCFVSFGGMLLLYLVLWIILPARTVPAGTPRRLYRSRENRTIGGVAAGLASYFNTEAWIVRLIFCLPLLASFAYPIFSHGLFDLGPVFVLRGLSGLFVVTYLIFWMILPEAISTSEKLQMKGEKVNLQSIKNAVKEENPQPPVQQQYSRLGRIAGVLIKALFVIIAGLIAFALLASLAALIFGSLIGSIHFMPVKDFLIENSWQEILVWATFILFVCLPFVALLTWLIRRIAGIRSRRHYLAYVFGALWIVGALCAVALAAETVRNFRATGINEETVRLMPPSTGKLYVALQGGSWNDKSNYPGYRRRWGRNNARWFLGQQKDSLFLRNIRVKIAKSRDTAFHINYICLAAGADRERAADRAAHIDYRGTQQDSLLLLPHSFTVNNSDKFRNQQVIAVIEVPAGKEIEINKNVRFSPHVLIEFDDLIWDDDDLDLYNGWEDTYRWKGGVEYRMTESGLERTGDKAGARGQAV